ncbi:Glu-tRNA(Gln) amidotransferase subunit GatD [Candidatus Micrarchaeota archaeon]|nr:Glu-tRNA(Gln) amidotransferase subunit GatD [Candidatus Micrarchaeota archaeon]
MSYSKAVEAHLKKQKIEPGDRIRYSGNKGTFEGILLPKPELGGSESCLMLKLDNGYNVGFECNGATLEKLPGSSVALGNVGAEWKPSVSTNVPKLSLVATGGTISTKVDYKTGGVYMLSEPAEILAKVPELAEIANIHRIQSPFRKASEDMDSNDWKVLANAVVDELNSDSEGVIVTHGTDILAYTAAALSFMIRDQNKPVAVTGAQRSPDRGSFDGALNLIWSSQFAASDCAEVAVVMHGSSSDDFGLAHVGTKCRKMHTSRRDAFQTINAQPWAKIGGKKNDQNVHPKQPDHHANQNKKNAVHFLRDDYNRRDNEKKPIADTAFEPKVAHIKAMPTSDWGMIDYLVEKKIRGIVLEGYALGHVPTMSKHSWIPTIQNAVDSGVTVVVATQCLNGGVHPTVYASSRKLAQTGVIQLHDMLPETAFVKLGWVLGHEKTPDKIREMMLTNVAHEFNERHQQDDFPGFKEDDQYE